MRSGNIGYNKARTKGKRKRRGPMKRNCLLWKRERRGKKRKKKERRARKK